MKILGYNISKVENFQKGPGRPRKNARDYHDDKQKYRYRQDLNQHRLAVESAGNIVNYNRHLLHNIYREVMADPSISAQWNTRVLKTLDKEFHVTRADDAGVDVAAMELFKAPWFYKWVKLVLEQHLWGFTLIEFGPWNDETNSFDTYIDSHGLFHDAVESVDRDYVKPEFGVITPQYGDGREEGISYLSGPLSRRLMFQGDADLQNNILYKAAQYMLMKDNAHKNWSEWAEVFATSLRIGKSGGGEAARRKLFETLRDMGNNGVGVIDEDDMFEYVNVNRQDAYEVYQAFLEYCDNEIAKLIFGQNVVTNNTGRVVGKVGEDLSNMYGDADAKLVQWVINKELIPYMIEQGVELEGLMFKYDLTEKVKLTDRANIDKNVSDMGWKLSQEYIERTYGVKTDEYIGIPFSGRENMDNESEPAD